MNSLKLFLTTVILFLFSCNLFSQLFYGPGFVSVSKDKFEDITSITMRKQFIKPDKYYNNYNYNKTDLNKELANEGISKHITIVKNFQKGTVSYQLELDFDRTLNTSVSTKQIDFLSFDSNESLVLIVNGERMGFTIKKKPTNHSSYFLYPESEFYGKKVDAHNEWTISQKVFYDVTPEQLKKITTGIVTVLWLNWNFEFRNAELNDFKRFYENYVSPSAQFQTEDIPLSETRTKKNPLVELLRLVH